MRWLLVPLGLAIAATAAWLLLAPPAGEPVPPAAGRTAPPPAVGARPEPASSRPLGEIDDASRRALERVLEREGVE